MMRMLGVPYTEEQVAEADRMAEEQARRIAQGLAEQDPSYAELWDKQIVALIAYLQALGQKDKLQ